MTTLRSFMKSFDGFSMQPFHYIVIIVLILYIAICFGRIASKNGRNPILWGILSIVTPINLIILGYWAFSGKKQKRSLKSAPKKKAKK
ncbi:MAG: hypothetical protein NTX75_13555 [Proteobacteria bacterium]|nr:hypothetical protein [Pseudomonadota bacterium]